MNQRYDSAAGQSAASFGYSTGVVGAFTGGASDTAPRQSEVGEQLERLSRACDTVGNLADQLTARLSGVLRQTGTGSNKAIGPAPDAVLCPMADVIRARRQQLERYADQFETLLGEIAL